MLKNFVKMRKILKKVWNFIKYFLKKCIVQYASKKFSTIGIIYKIGNIEWKLIIAKLINILPKYVKNIIKD